MSIHQERKNSMEIRHLIKSDDKIAISHVYEESWKFAYKGIVPQDYLNQIPVGQWAEHLNQAEMPEYMGRGYGKKLLDAVVAE